MAWRRRSSIRQLDFTLTALSGGDGEQQQRAAVATAILVK